MKINPAVVIQILVVIWLVILSHEITDAAEQFDKRVTAIERLLMLRINLGGALK